MFDKIEGFFGLMIILVWLAAIAGWIMNIITLIKLAMVSGPVEFTLIIVLRIIGIFVAPLGAILGWF